MSNLFQIEHTQAHRALDDADATAKLLLKYLEVFKNKGITKVNHLYYPKNRFELDLISFKKHKDISEIYEAIDKIKVPHIVTLKGEKGVIVYAFPCKGELKEEKDHVKAKIKDINWQTLTIKLKAPFTESLISYNHLYNKIESTYRKESIDFLWKLHIPKDSKKELLRLAKNQLKADFIIMNNLVPDQFSIYPMISLGHRNELTFRYPAHKKKLLQFINSRSGKIENNKQRRIHYPPALKEFMDCYMMYIIKEKKELFIFDKAVVKNKEEAFIKSLEEFLSKNPNPYNYPQDYV